MPDYLQGGVLTQKTPRQLFDGVDAVQVKSVHLVVQLSSLQWEPLSSHDPLLTVHHVQ